ncbi:glycosyltransferase family 2 protein [Photobacterium rosenbergii]|uniref:glycosyltransferase family 2 protein n=1 Tax=Photobacterium rosenbergii TaxID=294936 RepID=UPI001C98E94B|nr:glycosyltransferase family 2 protein [Photobacterium rosenbergii]MBY5947411.1 glycosyltransferase family 2 protein [Photobacterium rosenbergii]
MIVIPMAGLSSRFFKAGFNRPKYMLEAHGESLFDHSIKSFEKYFETKRFLFIIRDIYSSKEFVEERVKFLGINNYDIVTLDCDTRGQAETVAEGLKCIQHSGAITIFNIDTFRPGFSFPSVNEMGAGYLEVFRGTGDNWSFAKPKNSETTLVSKTAEKKPISDLCCTGLYHFSDINNYIEAYNDYITKPESSWEKGELYVAPLYNYLIMKGYDVHYNLIPRDNVIFCGVPEEYYEFKQNER